MSDLAKPSPPRSPHPNAEYRWERGSQRTPYDNVEGKQKTPKPPLHEEEGFGMRVSNVAIGYGASPLLQSLSLTLRGGEFVCLLGPNGAGKSTLLRTLAGMQPPLAGRVMIGGDDLYRLSPRQLAQRVAVVLTERIDIGMMTAYALAALGRYPHTDWRGRISPNDAQAVDSALAAVGAERLAGRMVAELSDGERQKVMIARALAQETPLLLLDEPTAFLDLPRRAELMTLLRRLAHDGNRAVLLSTHDLDLALRTADRVWLLEDGVLHDGAPEDLILNGTFERAFYADGVAFDSSSGIFRLSAAHAGDVALTGHGDARAWTARALERAGYRIHDDAARRVIVIGAAAARRWQVWQGERCTDHATIAALLDGLREGL
jgi:iron complex transport system ATP-binding protein